MGLQGLRVTFTKGIPGPWSEAAQAFFDIKRTDFQPVSQIGGAPNEALNAGIWPRPEVRHFGLANGGTGQERELARQPIMMSLNILLIK
jgi:hypothetical protein